MNQPMTASEIVQRRLAISKEFGRRDIEIDFARRITGRAAIRIATKKVEMLEAHIKGSQTDPTDWEVREHDIVVIDSRTGRMDVRFYCRYYDTPDWRCFGEVNLIPPMPKGTR